MVEGAALEKRCAATYRGFESLPLRQCYTSRMKKLFEVQQKITLIGNEYRIIKGSELAGYLKQKRLALREQLTLYADEQQSTILATSKARNIMDISPVFDVQDGNGKPLAVIRKEFKKSLLSSTWNIYDKDESQKPLFTVGEKNKTIAIARRVWELIPVETFIPFPFKFHFSIFSDNKIIGEYTKLTLFRDHYALNIEEKEISKLDEQAWMVLAVLLDAMQSR